MNWVLLGIHVKYEPYPLDRKSAGKRNSRKLQKNKKPITGPTFMKIFFRILERFLLWTMLADFGISTHVGWYSGKCMENWHWKNKISWFFMPWPNAMATHGKLKYPMRKVRHLHSQWRWFRFKIFKIEILLIFPARIGQIRNAKNFRRP